MKTKQNHYTAIAAICTLGALSPVHAATTALVDSGDKSGTNPIAFTFDARIYNEYRWLNVPGDGAQNVTTFEFRAPFADGKWQFRTRLYANHLDVDRAGIDEFGFGDMDIRFLTVPVMNLEKRFAFAYGCEFFLPTASDDVLGSDAFAIGPQVFLGFFAPFGGLVDLIAPGYQHRFSVWEDDGASDVHLGVIDLYFVKTFNDKQQWLLIDPQGLLDYENDNYWSEVDVEFGTMLPAEGHSIWLRPSFGIGGDRRYDASVEVGYKIVW